MNAHDVAAAVAAGTGLTRSAAEDAVRLALDTITAELAAGGTVALAGFGTFEVRDRAARTGRNPRTGEPLDIPPGRTLAFRPAARVRTLLRT